MSEFLAARGCVYAVPSSGGEQGFYDVAGLTHGVKSDQKYPILIYSVSEEDVDISSAVTTLGGIRILYRFGRGVGNVRVSGEMLLGSTETVASSSAQKRLKDFFEENRLSVKAEPCNVTVPGGRGIKVYFNSLVIGDVNPEFHNQPFQLVGYLADLG